MSGRPITTMQVRRVVELAAGGTYDPQIAAEVGIGRTSVRRIRTDHNLPANHRRGRPTREETRS